MTQPMIKVFVGALICAALVLTLALSWLNATAAPAAPAPTEVPVPTVVIPCNPLYIGPPITPTPVPGPEHSYLPWVSSPDC